MDFPWKTQYLSSKEIDIYNLYIFKEFPTFSSTETWESEGPWWSNDKHFPLRLQALLFMLVFATNPQIIQILPARALWQLIHEDSGKYFPACEELGPHF